MSGSERRILNNRLRRRRERRKNILLFILAVCLAFSLSFRLGGFLSNAESGREEAAQHKYYASIAVKEGDTLWSIAQEHMGTHYDSVESYIAELCRINSLDGDKIQAGMYLVIPYYAAADRE